MIFYEAVENEQGEFIGFLGTDNYHDLPELEEKHKVKRYKRVIWRGGK